MSPKCYDGVPGSPKVKERLTTILRSASGTREFVTRCQNHTSTHRHKQPTNQPRKQRETRFNKRPSKHTNKRTNIHTHNRIGLVSDIRRIIGKTHCYTMLLLRNSMSRMFQKRPFVDLSLSRHIAARSCCREQTYKQPQHTPTSDMTSHA